MPQTQTKCPRCGRPAMADVEQVFDVTSDPQAKQRFLSGQSNVIQCSSCGFAGPLPVPIVYHDNEKEFLLTYFPMELNVPVNEQEKQIGPLIKRITDNLPPEKRKSYLFQPQTMFTFQTMLEKVLEGDGITKDMVDAQQKQMQLLEKLITATPEQRTSIMQEEDGNLIDENFLALMARISEGALAQGNQEAAKQVAELQSDLIEQTEVGKKFKIQAEEVQAAMKELQDAGQQGLTREKLLDMLVDAPSEIYLSTIVNMAHSGLDYEFFQILTNRIDAASDDKKGTLESLRTVLLEMTAEIQKNLQEHRENIRTAIQQLIAAPDIEQATQQILGQIDQTFVEVLQAEVEEARKNSNLDQLAKLQSVMAVLEKSAAPPPEVEFIDKLMEVDSDEARQAILEENAEKVTPELVQMLNGILNQIEGQGQPPEVTERLQAVYRAALRFSMKRNLSES
jgi:hypothetical protein